MVAGRLVQIQAELVADFQFGRSRVDVADPQFRALQIKQDAHGAMKLAFQRAHDAVDFLMIGMRAVGEIHAEHIDAGFKQLFDGFLAGRRRA